MSIDAAAAAAALLATPALAQQQQPGYRDTPLLPGGKWHVHDADRPYPKAVTPAATPADAPSDAPSDAIVLLGARQTDAWIAERKAWPVVDGVMTVPPRAWSGGENNVRTRQSFGDVQFHLEFRSPTPPAKASQDRGNSGIWFMDRYEVQILDSHRNPTYADGTVGAIYGWKPPLVNPSRRPGEWQSYDIVFERPRFAADGALLRPAYVTAFLNGVLVQNHQAMLGTTAWRAVSRYTAHPDAAPIRLQDHDAAVSFRNIWVRPLGQQAVAQDLVEEPQ